METGVPFELITPNGTIVFNRYWDVDLYQLVSVTGVVPTVRRTSKDRPHVYGQRIGLAGIGGMSPVLEGRFVAAPSVAASMRANLLGCLYSIMNEKGTLRWQPSHDPGSWRRVEVKLAETPDDSSGGLIKSFQFQLVALRPFIYGEASVTANTSFLSASSGGGLMMPFTLPFTFTGSSTSGAGIFRNSGQLPSFPVIRVYGPITNPVIRNTTTGEAIVTTDGLTIAAGQFLEIDTYEESILLNGNPYLPLDRYVDTVQTEYFPLIKGDNTVQLSGSSPDVATTRVQLTWEHSYAG